MSSPSAVTKKRGVPLAVVLTVLVVTPVLVLSVAYLQRPVEPKVESGASQDAKAYLANLALSDVNMQASENLMNQKVVEVLGTIANNGPRELKSIDVFCLFYGVDGREIHRERLRIIGGAKGSLKPTTSKSFRMPFDSLPDGWNQALPKMVIAQITFAD
jgi:hypothetical protein